MENHHHCRYCGDVIKASGEFCDKTECRERHRLRNSRCRILQNGYIFRPGKCVIGCPGHGPHLSCVQIDEEKERKQAKERSNI